MGGANNFVAPSDQLTRGIIGVGGIGRSGHHFASDQSCRLVAVCDVDQKHLDSAVAAAKKNFNETVKAYHDFRELIHDPNVDIVHIATPPHWHGIMSVEAANAGKDIFCEKPMTRTIGEGKRVEEAVKRNARVFRLNTWFRFKDTFYGLGTDVKPLKKLVDSGLLGWPLKVRISGATGFTWKFYWVGKENLEVQPIPKELDYDLWLGPAPYKPYNIHRTHQTFRGYFDYDGGGLADMGQHYIEGFESEGKVPYIEGPKGKVYKGFECTILNVQELINEMPDPEPRNTDFLECVRNRRQFALNETNGHHSATIVNMGVCALRLNRTLHFDPKTQLFINDEAANLLINQPMRGEWGKMI